MATTESNFAFKTKQSKYMKNTKILPRVLTILLCNFSLLAIAQPGGTTPDPGMRSGPSNNYGINNIYNTSVFDGTANVNIPIYTFTNDFGNFGVSLAYNTKGILVDEIENPCGLHWQIVASASIERIVKDVPDEMIYDSQADSIYSGATALWNKTRYIKGKLATYWETPQQQAMTNVYRDGECDQFVVNLNGSSFTFYLGNQLNIFTHPHRDIKVRMFLDGVPLFSVTQEGMATGPSDNVLSFEIQDENGVKYLFEQSELEHQTYYDNTYWSDRVMGGAVPITRWDIKKITFTDGKIISYNSEHSWNSGFGPGSYTKYRNGFVRESSSGTATFAGYKDFGGESYFSQLQNINFPNGDKVLFTYNSSITTPSLRKQLSDIRVTSQKTSQNCIKYKFNQSQINERWYLDSIGISDCDNVYSEKFYSFKYNDVKLPKRLNNGQDLFGYYNADSVATPVGTSGTGLNIPKHHYSVGGALNYGLGKAYLPYYAQAGLLTKIRNAFGGEVRFVYKNNTSDIASPFVIPGSNENFVGTGTLGMDGVAVDSIIAKDKFHQQEAEITVYDYHQSGRLFIPGGYIHYPEYINQSTNYWDTTVYQGLYLTAHQFVDGTNHGYSNVGVKKYNAAGQLLSRVEMTFTNIGDNLSPSRFYKVPGSKELHEYPYANKQYIKDWEIGLPLEVREYDHNDRIIRSTTSEYEFSPVDLSASTFANCTKTSNVNTGAKTVIPFGQTYYATKKTFTDSYYPFTGTALLKKVTIKDYVSDTRFVTDIAQYTYDNRNNVSSILNTDSKGEVTETKAIYNYTVSDYGGINPNSSLSFMASANIQKLVSMERWKLNNTDPSVYSKKLLDAFIVNYRYFAGRLYQKSLHNSNFSKASTYTNYTSLTVGSPNQNPYGKIMAVYDNQASVSLFQKTNEVTIFDTSGNELETRYINDGKYSAAIYDSSTNDLLAEATNARYSEIGFTSFEDLGSIDSWKTRGNLELNSQKLVNISGSVSLTSISGDYIYSLTPPGTSLDYSDILGTKDLSAGKNYILSFWSNGGIPQVYYGTTLLPAPSGSETEWNGWKNYIYRFTATSSRKIRIAPLSNVTIYLDEIRLHPADADMNSFTYQPSFGIRSSTNSAGRLTYYEYDKLGRLSIIRDQNRNIVSKSQVYINGGL